MRFGNMTKGVLALSALLVAAPALAAGPTVDTFQNPLTVNQSLSAVGITGPGSTTIIKGSHYTSFSGGYSISDLPFTKGNTTKSTFSGVDVPITTHAGGWLEVTISAFTKVQSGKPGTGFYSLTGSIDGTPITLTSKNGALYTGTALVQVAKGVNVNNLVFGGVTASNNAEFSGNYTFVATTPEPAAWFMMITGLAFLGAMLRRRRELLVA